MKDFMKKVICFFVFFLLFSVVAEAGAEKGIGLVNLQIALNTSVLGKKAMDKLKVRMENENNTTRAKEDELKRLEEQISRQGLLMKESEKREKEAEYMRKRKSLERSQEDIREELTRLEREMTKKIVMEIVSVARKIGQEEGYSMIMEKGQSILYSTDSIDITEKVIARYNKLNK